MRNLVMIFALALVACGTSSTSGPDGGGDTDGDSSIGDGHGGDGNGGDGGGSSAYKCTTPANNLSGCCVFDSPSSCQYAKAPYNTCFYYYGDDQATFTSPSQGNGICRDPSLATLPDGATCNVNNIEYLLGPYCQVGSWCAYDANTSTANNNKGTCRKLCDPLDQAAHGCTGSLTCVGMLYCATASQWPNCPSATNTHMGFCQ